MGTKPIISMLSALFSLSDVWSQSCIFITRSRRNLKWNNKFCGLLYTKVHICTNCTQIKNDTFEIYSILISNSKRSLCARVQCFLYLHVFFVLFILSGDYYQFSTYAQIKFSMDYLWRMSTALYINIILKYAWLLLISVAVSRFLPTIVQPNTATQCKGVQNRWKKVEEYKERRTNKENR